MSRDEKLRLTHIAEAAALIADYLKGVSKEAFLNDRLRQDAVIRRIQIIGEAVRHLSRELLATMPDFPAKQARGMRNVLVHDYDGLNLERLWETATQDIPAIKRVVENVSASTYWPQLTRLFPKLDGDRHGLWQFSLFFGVARFLRVYPRKCRQICVNPSGY